ncbi:SUMO-interacting motif-containing protein 1 isoform X2 [Triplophysa dalaica]|uniref:SUMO-interacting motif-containing protein 1 isoform X2 n=1 Tax=Triplophysa dalaica TaxID=1582913 RepID=UPI0024E03D21|nr:SUMO-interacting motif-containing protein 1 isoform X2 [Triplophysa dalaica]
MADIISVSSGSDEDSDIMLIGSYKEAKEDAVPFIRQEWLPVTPVLIDITHQKLVSSIRKGLRRDNISPLVIDLTDVELGLQDSAQALPSIDTIYKHVGYPTHPMTTSFGKAEQSECPINDSGKDLASSECSQDIVQSANERTFERSSEVLKDSFAVSQNTEETQLSPTGCGIRADQEKENSPYSLDSPYYCPSEVDAVLFSDESNNDTTFKTWCSPESPQIHHFESHTGLQSTEDGATVNTGDNKDVNQMSTTQIPPSSPSTQPSLGVSPCNPECAPKENQSSKANSPTSTEILASDTAAHSPGLSTWSLSSSNFTMPISLPSSPALLDVASRENSPTRLMQMSIGEDHKDDNVESNVSEENAQHICLAQFRKLRQCVVGTVSHMSLSLVYSTIEENYPEGTLQLLGDFIQPRYYPPVAITSHLLRGIFLDTQSSYVLAIEAYNLLMKIQRYHPADKATIPWDWELLSSVMEEKDDTKRLRTEVRCMLLQYVLQVLEDDFQFKLTNRHLQDSVAKEMLSCDQRFRRVKDLINWLMNAVKEPVHHSEDVKYPKRESNNCLKIVLSLQRMLTLALEVDKAPTRNSSKLSQELFQKLHTLSPCRQRRLLFLSTLESKLLRCKLLDMLLDDACSQKITLPMSLSMLLHYLQSATLPSDPSVKQTITVFYSRFNIALVSFVKNKQNRNDLPLCCQDGGERWRKWDELLQLLWMLTLSYEEVVTGHLQYPITERFKKARSPLWTQNDQVKRSAVRRAAEAFQSRAVKDIGHDISMEMKESLSQLQDHITDTSSVIQIH